MSETLHRFGVTVNCTMIICTSSSSHSWTFSQLCIYDICIYDILHLITIAYIRITSRVATGLSTIVQFITIALLHIDQVRHRKPNGPRPNTSRIGVANGRSAKCRGHPLPQLGCRGTDNAFARTPKRLDRVPHHLHPPQRLRHYIFGIYPRVLHLTTVGPGTTVWHHIDDRSIPLEQPTGFDETTWAGLRQR